MSLTRTASRARGIRPGLCSAIAMSLVLLAFHAELFAQSGSRQGSSTRGVSPSRSAAGSRSATPGSTTRTLPGSTSKQASAPLAMEGYCPVCIIEMRKWVRGNPEHHAVYDGRMYLFPESRQKEAFLANPEK